MYSPLISFSDFVKVAISIAIIAVIRMKSILYSATPYLMLCMLFVAYVVWNGGVVLGMFAVAI